eukprot:268080-Pyramimonas_sp.AAC.1
MPAKIPSATLSALEPTKEELAEARKILAAASAKEKRSKLGSMMNFLKSNPDEAASSSRGQQREAYMAKFLVHQMRVKTASNTSTSSRTVGRNDEKGIVWTWISPEKMDTVLGPMKAQHWRDSKLLAWRPDSLTQSEDEAFREYKVPEHWEKMSEQDISKLLIESKGEATEEDLANVDSASWKNEGGGQANDDTFVKQEEETALQKLEKKITQLKQNPRSVFDKFTTMTVEAKKIETNGEAS